MNIVKRLSAFMKHRVYRRLIGETAYAQKVGVNMNRGSVTSMEKYPGVLNLGL